MRRHYLIAALTLALLVANVKRWVDEYVEVLSRRIERARIEEERAH